MSNNDSVDLQLLDDWLYVIQFASERLKTAWSEVFNRPFRNTFRKLDYSLFELIVDESLEQLASTRSATVEYAEEFSIVFELDEYASYLERFGMQLKLCLNKLSEKAEGGAYPLSEYREDQGKLDSRREELIKSQEKYNLALRNIAAREV